MVVIAGNRQESKCPVSSDHSVGKKMDRQLLNRAITFFELHSRISRESQVYSRQDLSGRGLDVAIVKVGRIRVQSVGHLFVLLFLVLQLSVIAYAIFFKRRRRRKTIKTSREGG